jgi:hypothetical protein
MEPSVILTNEQREALRQGEALRVTDPETQLECIVVRADVYDRVRGLVVDDGQLTEEERLALIRAAGARADWDDPELDVYEEYRKKP